METTVALSTELEDEKMSSYNHSVLQSRLAFLLLLAYRSQYSILTELDFEFASGKTRPDLSILPKRPTNWLNDEIVVQDVPLTTIEILSPSQPLDSLIERVYQKHFPAGVKTVWIVSPALQLVTIFLPNRQHINVTEGNVTDPVTGIQVSLAEIFEG
ncbi:Uma2 family endonuclease [Larkinella sp. VNQ87]|uniref:Uma2 family endonuclease n=1 Tax=Larkinella sp. VNQ87 TaxID=3400921 RepID=UPI003C007BBF